LRFQNDTSATRLLAQRTILFSDRSRGMLSSPGVLVPEHNDAGSVGLVTGSRSVRG